MMCTGIKYNNLHAVYYFSNSNDLFVFVSVPVSRNQGKNNAAVAERLRLQFYRRAANLDLIFSFCF